MNLGADMIVAFQVTRGWTNERLAKEAGVTAVTIANLRNGTLPTTRTLAKLRRVRGLGGLEPEHFTNGGTT